MDFFGQQDRARASTRRLVCLFVVALVLTNLMVYGAVAAALRLTYLFTHAFPSRGWLSALARHFCAEGIGTWELLGWVTLAVTAVVGLVTFVKLRQLSRGGAMVATWLGGRRVNFQTDDADERQLLNVVEEMAIASGVPVPEVFLLDEECGINAFAAGNDPTDAALGVTFGAVKLLTRDEIQGIIAHEFSHILNGDMRLNTRLIGWLHGVLGLVVLGRFLTLNFLSRHKTADGRPVRLSFHPAFLPAFVVGWICLVAGSFGAFAARLIKSAVSRQREYLADSAAVQFTRNPDGLAGALKKIGGLQGRSLIEAARAEEASHMYFSDGMKPRWFGFLATHPPLTKRIQRINPRFDGQYPRVSLERVLQESRVTELYREHGGKPVDYDKLASVVGNSAAAREMLFASAARRTEPLVQPANPLRSSQLSAVTAVHLEFATRILRDLPASLRAATQQPLTAEALMYGLICSRELELRARQLQELSLRTEPELVTELQRLLPEIDDLDAEHYLPLADLAVRALRHLSREQFELFESNLTWLVESDQQIDVFEFMLRRMIVRHLASQFRRVKKSPVQYYNLKPLLPACEVILSGLTRIGHESESEAEQAFSQGATRLTCEQELRFLPLADCNLLQIDAAINEVAQASVPLKRQILAALVAAAATDGILQRREAELLRAVADAWDQPTPPFLDASQNPPHA